MVRPSIQPSSRNRCSNLATRLLQAERVAAPRNPMVLSFAGCCASAARGATKTPASDVTRKRRRSMEHRRATGGLGQAGARGSAGIEPIAVRTDDLLAPLRAGAVVVDPVYDAAVVRLLDGAFAPGAAK